MSSLYACIIRTADDDILTDIIVSDNWLKVVEEMSNNTEEGIEEVHMCAIATVEDEPTTAQRNEAIRWIARHLV